MNASHFSMPALYLKVDETGTPGKRQKGKTHYVMAGCLVGDEEAFNNVTARRYKGKELKFHDDRSLREEIIREAEPFVDAVYYVEFCKPTGWHLDEGNKQELVDLHRSLLRSLAAGISKDNPGTVIRTVIDHTTLISDYEARRIVAAQSDDRVIMSPSVADSKSDFGLMTNDFFVGAIGYMLNTPYESMNPRGRFIYSDLFRDRIVKLSFQGREAFITKNAGNPGRRYPATSQATQTSCGVRTTSPSEEGLRSLTNKTPSKRGYKTAAPKKGAVKNRNAKKVVGNPRCRDPATSQATQTSCGVQANSPAEAVLIDPTNKTPSKSGYKTAAPKKSSTAKKKRTASNPASSGRGIKRIRK